MGSDKLQQHWVKHKQESKQNLDYVEKENTMSAGHQPNRLIYEKSPYLIQHANNPVNWYPWGEEAFEAAKKQDKPIFLSIGYSTCHWCHVMEAESFEDLEVADALNRDFISIKVDKEERPDIDTVYMNVCQIVTGQGGWPTTIFMTPDQKPFFAGTYYPKRAIQGRIGLLDLLVQIQTTWKEHRGDLLSTADQILGILENQTPKRTSKDGGESEKESEREPSAESIEALISNASKYFVSRFDERYGGFGTSPKFPSPHNLLFLMHLHEKKKDSLALEMTERTLEQLYRGGINDHIGGGFARYSTDRQWLAPHFEKMLYDNALLIMAYTKAYELTKDALYEDVVNDSVSYLIREMQSPNGGFYSAQDADSEGKEGKFYLFTPTEVAEVLGEEEARVFCDWYDITAAGNFEGLSIPNLLRNPDYRVKQKGVFAHKEKLVRYRKNRMELRTDDKILTSWNGLLIAALAQAYRVFHNRTMLEGAERAAAFIQQSLTRKNGGLRVRFRDREAIGVGFLDDYAFTIWGFLELYEATKKVAYLQSALDYNNRMIEDFRDEEQGGYFLTSIESESLIYRPKETYDGAIPSGNSVAARNLIRLARRMESKDLEDLAKEQIGFLQRAAKAHPAGHSMALLAMAEYVW